MNSDELCLCNSGKLYKDCCSKKIKFNSSEKVRRIHMAKLNEYRNKSKRYCIHPKQEECEGIIIGAHNMQENGILNKIEKEGHVLLPIYNGFNRKINMTRRGIENQATVFSGFCSKHDNKVFEKIELPEVYPFNKTHEQLFLYAYKSFAFTYYKVHREDECFNKLKNLYDYTDYPQLFYTGYYMDTMCTLIDIEKKYFDECILKKDYRNLTHIVGELNYEVSFATSTMFSINYDLFGNRILFDDSEVGLSVVYLTIFPGEGRTYYILSWFKKDDKYYLPLKKQISMVTENLIKKYINNLLVMQAENIAISPYLWESWTSTQQKEFIELSELYLNNEESKFDCSNYYKERSFNLFDRV